MAKRIPTEPLHIVHLECQQEGVKFLNLGKKDFFQLTAHCAELREFVHLNKRNQ